MNLIPIKHPAKIVHIVEAFGAGTLSMVSAMANAQAKDGHSITIIHSVREETPDNWRALFAEAIRFIQLPMVRAINPAADWRAGRALYHWLRELKPEVVHMHSSKAGALGRIVSLFIRGNRQQPAPRWFFSPHGLSFLQRAEGRLKNTIFLTVEKILSEIPTTFIACSPSEGAEIQRHLSSNVLVVNNAVDVAAIHPAKGNQDMVRIGTVGRVTLARNPELFASIASQVAQPGVEFVWIGGGDVASEKNLKNANVKLSGWVDRSQALEQLANLDIYMQTSRWEGLPVAVIEAMAAGLPVLATNVVGNKDLVIDGENGYLCENSSDFVKHLHTLIEDRNARQRLGAQAKRFAEANYSLDKMMASLYKAYGLT
ncbi:glycosyltransferase [Iodobacter ciconiae]|uniref:Glycosyltransferase family 1 protein n=1 Tax=Iodobacter ciconiae TaxID=2496266 RepID=A0A3S8ZTY1_9NEIS|nr:glycosyltransferase [Iodobacter ciconiae]AZN36967.1 glycosyltransferase family 1 protein [Iodobacter ciconiae]